MNNFESTSSLARSAKPEKSQEELRSVLEQKFRAIEPELKSGMQEYSQALKSGAFEDQAEEEEGMGEKRKVAFQEKLNALYGKADKMKEILESGQELPQEPVMDVEALKNQNEAFLGEIFGTPENDFTPTLVKPADQDYAKLKAGIEEAKFGEYTLNPDTQNLDFENIPESKIFVPDLSALEGKQLHEVAKYLIDNYADKYHIPGLEYWKWLRDNPTKSPKKLQDGKNYFEFGSLVRHSSGRWDVPGARWDGSVWLRDADWLGFGWNSRCRVVLLEI